MKKFPIAFMFLLILSHAAQAGPREDSLQGIARCGQQSQDRAWLDCVYGAVQPMRASLGLPPAPAFQQRLAAAAQHTLRTEPSPAIAPIRHSDDRWTPLRAYSFDKHGMFTITLSDGTVWRQDESDVNYAHWRYPASRYVVSVAGGLFGGATLEVRNNGAQYSVHRLR